MRPVALLSLLMGVASGASPPLYLPPEGSPKPFALSVRAVLELPIEVTMNFFVIIFKNLFRNKRRTLSHIFGVLTRFPAFRGDLHSDRDLQ